MSPLSLDFPDDRFTNNLRLLLSNWAAQVFDALNQSDRSTYSTVKMTGEMRGINWWYRKSIDGRSLRWLTEQSCQPILATSVQQGRSCGTSTGQESPQISPPSARHVRDASEDLEQNSSTTSASSCDGGTILDEYVGPLQRTKQGNKYVLTFMDFATRYPEAIPLRKIDAATVAEALRQIFTRLVLPQEILSNQGSNFMSHLMKQVTEILEIWLKTTISSMYARANLAHGPNTMHIHKSQKGGRCILQPEWHPEICPSDT